MAFREVERVEIKELLRRLGRKESLSSIARGLGICRKTVRRYRKAADALGLNLNGSVPTEEDMLLVMRWVQRKRKRPEAVSEKQLLPHKTRIVKELEKDSLRLTKVHDRLTGCGVEVPYSSLHRFARKHCKFGKPQTTVRVADTEPGEAVEVDWGTLGKIYDPETGRKRYLRALSVVLLYSRHQYVHLSFAMKSKDLIEGLEGAWEFFGGVARRVVVDNMKTAVKKADRYRPEKTREFIEYSQARDFIIDPTNKGHPQGKPKVERAISYIRDSFFRGEIFWGLADAQERCVRWCLAKAGLRTHGTTKRVPFEVFESEEKSQLKPREKERYDVPEWAECKVHPDHHIQFKKALYSVPTAYVRNTVTVRGDSKLVRIYYQGKEIKLHQRQEPGKRSTDYADYPEEKVAYAMRSPEYSIRQAARYGTNTEEFCRQLLSGDFPWARLRQAQKLIRLGKKYGAKRVDSAARRALSFDLIDVKRLERIIKAGLEGQIEPLQGKLIPLPGRFLRPAESFSQTEKEEER